MRAARKLRAFFRIPERVFSDFPAVISNFVPNLSAKLFLRFLMRKLLCLTLVAGLGLAFSANAQPWRHANQHRDPDFVEPRGWSLGGTFGISDLWGDVGTKSIIDHYVNDNYSGGVKFMGSLYARYTFSPALSARIGAGHGTLYANDNWNINKARKAGSAEDDAFQRYLRNQNIRSKVWEGQLLAEFYPLRMSSVSSRARKRFQPYLLLGASVFYYQPKTEYTPRNGGDPSWVDVRDLRTEGEGFVGLDGKPLATPKQYSLTQFAIPMGLAVRWDIGENLGLGIEYLYRYCFTDYLDDVSGAYIDPMYFDVNLPADKAAIAKDVYDKRWQIMPTSDAGKKGMLRGNSAVNDAFSSISVNFFYRIGTKQPVWWR